MFGDIFFSGVQMPGETLRIILAFIGVALAAYADTFHRRNIEDAFLFSLLGIGLLVNIVFFQPELSVFAITLAAVIGLFGYAFYRFGHIGGADVILFAYIALLLPIHPSMSDMPFNFPFVLSVLVFSGALFALYFIIKYGADALDRRLKGEYAYALFIIPYLAIVWLYMQTGFFTPAYFAIISILYLSFVFFSIYKKAINDSMTEEIPVQKLEEGDVLALEKMEAGQAFPSRLVTSQVLSKLKEDGVEKVWAYTKLPPFVPFILGGMILALFFANQFVPNWM
ncbi:MAG: A24 family peptidase [Candidatus Bilamarchaeaceae archaeon]